MPRSHLVAVPCALSPGMVSGERVFAVKMANGQTYRGIAPRQFCWNGKGQLVAEDEPAQETRGCWVAARVIGHLDGGQVSVEVPDGEVIAVEETDVQDRPTPILPPGASQMEQTTNVPVRQGS